MIDWARVQQLQDEVGAEDFDEVIDMFIEEVEIVVARLGEEQTSAELASHMHFLKGSSLSLGFHDFASLCSDGERNAGTDQMDKVDIASLIHCYEASKSVFLAEYRGKLVA